MKKRSILVLTTLILYRCDFSAKAICTADSPCESGSFCNFDDDTSGFCEECTVDLCCTNLGLINEKGVDDCQDRCDEEDYCQDRCDKGDQCRDRCDEEYEEYEFLAVECVDSSFQIYSVDVAQNHCEIHPDVVQVMKSNGYTKVMCPFGVLVLGSANYPDNTLKVGANYLANMIDSDNDGKADNNDVLENLAHRGIRGKGKALNCGVTQEEERSIDDNMNGILEYTFSCHTWKSSGISKEVKATLFEESFHLMHSSWATTWPDIFGFDSFTSSIVCRETARLQCCLPGWFHPENKCPGDGSGITSCPAESPLQPGDGDCTSPDCDCAEFYRQAVTLYADWTELNFWYSPNMPSGRADFIDMSSQELMDVMADPQYNQIQAPLSESYSIQGVEGTCNDCDNDDVPPNDQPTSTPIGFCFAGDNEIVVNGESTKMKNAKVGDNVMVDEEGNYGKIYSFGHYLPGKKITDYIHIESTDPERRPLVLSGAHMVFIKKEGKRIAIRSDQIMMGDKLISIVSDSSSSFVVSRILKNKKGVTGAYAPFTNTGTIVVNGVVASCYVALIQPTNLEKKLFGFFSHQSVAHFFESPHRLYCCYYFFADECRNEKYTDEGLSSWVAFPFEVTKWLLESSIWIQISVLFPISFVCAFFNLLECAIKIEATAESKLFWGAISIMLYYLLLRRKATAKN